MEFEFGFNYLSTIDLHEDAFASSCGTYLEGGVPPSLTPLLFYNPVGISDI